MTVHPALYGGTLGPLFLVLVPAACWRPHRTTSTLAVGCAAYFAVWASPISSYQIRFLAPMVPVLAVLAAEGMRRLADAARTMARRGPAAVTLIVATLLVVNLPPFIEWHETDRHGWTGWLTHVVRGAPAAVVLGAESERAYLARTVPSYRAWRFIDEHLPATATVLTFSGGDQLYSGHVRVWSDAAVARGITWGAPVGDEAAVLAGAKRLGITHVLFDKQQFETGAVRDLAIADERMMRCCLSRAYEDDRYVLYAVAPRVSGALRAADVGIH